MSHSLPSNPPRRLRWALLIGAVTLAALLLRAWTARQSLPFVDHPDEPNPISYVVEMLRTGDPNQRFFQKPSLYIYLLLALLTAHYRRGLAGGLYTDLSSMVITTHTVTTLPGFFLWARWLTACIGALTALFAYRLAAREWSRAAGLVAALFIATQPFHLRFSQYVTTDVTAAWLVLLAVSAAILVARTGRWRAYLVAGAFAGLAASTKYNAGVAALAVVAASLARAWDESREQRTENREQRTEPALSVACPEQSRRAEGNKEQRTDDPGAVLGSLRPRSGQALFSVLRSSHFWRLFWGRHFPRLCAAGAAAIVCFVAGTPYALLSWSQVSGGIARQWNNYDGGNGHFQGAWNLGGYLEFFWDDMGAVACLATLTGLALLWRRHRGAALAWLGFVLPSLLLHLSRPTHFTQNMLPIIVCCALPVGIAVVEPLRWLVPFQGRFLGIKKDISGREVVRCSLFLVLCSSLLVPAAVDSARYVLRQAGGDTRVQLMDWIDANVPPGARIAAELKPVPDPRESRWTDMPVLPMRDMAWYRQQGFAYLVACSRRWGQIALPESYLQLTGGRHLAEFGTFAEDAGLLGPHLFVYATGLTEEDVPLRPAAEVRVGSARFLGIALGAPAADSLTPGLYPTREFQAGGVLGLRSFWQAETPFAQDLFIFVHVLDASGNRVAQRDTAPWQGRFPTSSWRPGSIVVDVNDVYLPPGMAPGEYMVIMGMYDPASWARPPVTVGGEPALEGAVEVTKIRVIR